jgi:uncharacterized membrane protein YfcA
MTLPYAIALFFAAMLGGGLNSVAGGGSFITFPTLIFTGVPGIQANATSTVALWPGSVASIGAYRHEYGKQRTLLAMLGVVSLIGGVLGALLLLHTPQKTFVRLIPYLLLAATLLFAFGGRITRWLHARSGKKIADDGTPGYSWRALAGIAAFQLLVATYGGYFGGGIGIVMLAMMALIGMENILAMNALKVVLQTCINGVAVITFAIAGAVMWPQAIVMVVGAIIGGYGAATIARRLDQRWVRAFVIAVGIGMTIYFFVQ